MAIVATIGLARESLQAHFLAAWQAGAQAVAGYEPEARWDNVESGAPEDTARAWVRFAVRHNAGSQRTFGGAGARRFEDRGVCFAQIFAPVGEGHALADGLAQVARQAFRAGKTDDGVRLTNVRIAEHGAEGPWWRIDVSADFAYDDIQ